MYASSWFLTLFLTFLPLPVATRIFDIFMYEVGKIFECVFKYQKMYLMWVTVYIRCTALLFHLNTYNQIYDPSLGPRDYLPCGPGHPAVQPDRPHSAGHGGHVAGKLLLFAEISFIYRFIHKSNGPRPTFPFACKLTELQIWTTDLRHSATLIHNRKRNQGTFDCVWCYEQSQVLSENTPVFQVISFLSCYWGNMLCKLGQQLPFIVIFIIHHDLLFCR